MSIVLQPCPFCGHKLDASDSDVLHPSGGWVDDPNGYRHYVTSSDPRKQGSCYKINCVEHYGGCGANLTGDSIDEVVNAWNKRVHNQTVVVSGSVWGWAIVDKDGIEHRVRARMRDYFGAILESEPFDGLDIAKMNVEFPGRAPYRIITLYTDSK